MVFPEKRDMYNNGNLALIVLIFDFISLITKLFSSCFNISCLFFIYLFIHLLFTGQEHLYIKLQFMLICALTCHKGCIKEVRKKTK